MICDNSMFASNKIKNIESSYVLMTNIALAKKAVKYAERFIEKSSTINCKTKAEHSEILNKISEMRRLKFSEERSFKDIFTINYNDKYDNFNQVVNIIKENTKNKVGNCGEFARIVGHFCLKYNIPFKLVTVKNQDHAFIIIGNDPDKPDQLFGPHAVVIDAWNKKNDNPVIKQAYPATLKNLETNLEHYLKTPITLKIKFSLGAKNYQARKNVVASYALKLDMLEKVLIQLPMIENTKKLYNAIQDAKKNNKADINESDLELIRRLTKNLQSYLTKILLLEDEYPQIKSLLIQAWLNGMTKWVEQMIAQPNFGAIDEVYIKILSHYPGTLIEPFMQQMNAIYPIDNAVIETKSHTVNLLQIFAFHSLNENLFIQLLNYTSNQTLNVLETEPTICYTNPHLIEYTNDLLHILHTVVIRGWKDSFNLLVSRLDKKLLEEIAKFGFNRINFLDYVAKNLGNDFAFDLYSKIVPDEVKKYLNKDVLNSLIASGLKFDDLLYMKSDKLTNLLKFYANCHAPQKTANSSCFYIRSSDNDPVFDKTAQSCAKKSKR